MAKQKNAYKLAYAHLSEGEHTFTYQLDEGFVEDNAAQDICSRPQVQVNLTLLKMQRMMKLLFRFEGVAFTPCDRCLKEISFPVDYEEEIIVKTVENPQDEPDTDDTLWCVGENDDSLDLAPYFRDVLVLTRPLQYFCPDGEDGRPTCDPAMLAVYEKENRPAEPEEDPRWDALKALRDKFNKE